MAKNDSAKKILSLSKLVYDDGTTFVPSQKEQQLVSEVVDLFRQAQSSRDRNFQFFDGLNLIDYINDSVLRFNTNVDERDGIEDWQAGVHDGFTRNKVLAILGKVMEVLPIAQFVGRGDEDTLRASILSDLYEFVEDIDDYEEFMTHLLLESIVKGTGIGYEDIIYQEKTFRDVEGIGDEITITPHKEKITKITSSIVPLEEFYPSSVSIRKIKDMPYCFWRKVLPYSVFMSMFGNYRKSQLVSHKQSYHDSENRPYYIDFIDSNIPDGTVEVIRFYDKMNDQFVIIANGIWLNPLGQEEVSPMPWNHKELPFWEVKFDFFGDFFYGKSLPNRLQSMQDVLNTLTNMLLDQSFLTIFPPLLTNGFDDIEDDYLRPGRRTPVDTQGLPINQAFQVLDMKTPTGWHQYILEYTRQVMEEGSLDKVSQGVAGAGDRTTAQEIRVAASGVAAMLQMFARMINNGIKRKAFLKASNIIQFGLNPGSPLVMQLRGEDANEEFNNAFTVIKKGDAVLTNGKRGTKVIEIYKDKESVPSRDTIVARGMLAEAELGKNVEIVAIPPTYLRNLAFDVKIVPNPKNESSKDIEKAIQLEKVRVYMSFFPDIIDRNELAAQTAEKMGDDPAKLLLPQALGIQPDNTGMEQDTGVSTTPNENTANNLVRSTGGMNQGMQEMAALQAQMTQ